MNNLELCGYIVVSRNPENVGNPISVIWDSNRDDMMIWTITWLRNEYKHLERNGNKALSYFKEVKHDK